jgi:excisionase family DNA binding protein
MPGPRYSLSEAASYLGVTHERAYALLKAGQLPGERRGSQWTVPVSALRHLEHNMWRGAGRPLAQSSAWKLLSARLPSWSSGDLLELDGLRRRLRARSSHAEVHLASGLLDRFRQDERVVLGGRDAAVEFAPVDPLDSVDAYVRRSDIDGLLDSYVMREVPEEANVHLHVVDDAQWPFGDGARSVEPWVAWLDLADAQDRAADTLLDRLVGGRVLA